MIGVMIARRTVCDQDPIILFNGIYYLPQLKRVPLEGENRYISSTGNIGRME